MEGPSRSPESIDVPADVTDNSESTRTPGEDDFDIDLGGESYRSSSEDDVSINLDFGGTSPEAPEVQESEIDLDFGTSAEPEPDEPLEVDEHDAGAEALETFRSEPGGSRASGTSSTDRSWRALHLQNLENRVSSLNMEDYI